MIQLNKGKTMTFESRFIEENEFGMPSQGGGIGDHLKKNWGKYATGAGAGALGMAASHIMGGNDGGVLDELQNAHEQGDLKDTILDKMQGGLGKLKSNDNMANFASDSSGHNSNDYSDGSGHNSNDYSDGSSSSSSKFGHWKPEFDKLSDITNGSDHATFATPAAAGNKAASTLNQLTSAKAAALPFAGAEEGNRIPFFGDENADHLRSTFMNNPEATMDPKALDAAAGEKVAANYDKQYDTYAKKLAERNEAIERLRSSSGDLTPDENKEYQTVFNQTLNAPTATAGNVEAVQNDAFKNVVQGNLDKGMSDSMNWARSNGFDFMLNGNINDDLAAFSQMKAGQGIPPQLEPIYKEVLRAARQK